MYVWFWLTIDIYQVMSDIFYSQKMSESCFRTNTGSLYHHPLEKLRIGNAE
jgi:hypothetical protein